jgi:hypothetical protein
MNFGEITSSTFNCDNRAQAFSASQLKEKAGQQ